jgi:hypothetical protein
MRNQRAPPVNATLAPVQPSARPPPVLNGAWGSFATLIKRDDDNLLAKATKQRELEQKAGIKYRPEIKEMYKDQQGKAEVVVHEKVGAPAVAKAEGSDSVVVKKDGSESVVVKKEDCVGDGSPAGTKLET